MTAKQNNVEDVINEVAQAELFEDGCEADMAEAGITRPSDAYMAGRRDCIEEIRLLLKERGVIQ